MPKYYTHPQTCSRKRTYTRQQAKRTARRLRKQTGKSILPYRCNVCGEWHVGKPK